MKSTGAVTESLHRKCSFLLGLAVFTCGLSLSARGESDLNTRIGVDFDDKRPLIASRVTTRPHVNFVNCSEDDAACPADKESCRKKAFLVPGDVVLTGRARRFHLCCISIFTPAGLDHGVAADIILVASRTDAVAENAGLDRLLVTSGGTISISRGKNGTLSRKRKDISRSGWRPQWCARRGG